MDDTDISTTTPWGAFTLDIGNDVAEAQQMQPFAADQTAPWWQSLIAYGATRAIDNRFGPTNVAGNTNTGTFAGQNGRTYVNNPNALGGRVVSAGGDGSGLLLIVAAVAALALAG